MTTTGGVLKQAGSAHGEVALGGTGVGVAKRDAAVFARRELQAVGAIDEAKNVLLSRLFFFKHSTATGLISEAVSGRLSLQQQWR